MAAKSNGFLMFNDWKPLIDGLTDEQVGNIVKGIYAVVNDENYEFRDDTQALAKFFLASIQKNISKYEETCQKRREAALKQHSKSKQMQANAESCIEESANEGNTRTRTRIIQEQEQEQKQEQEKYKNKNNGELNNPFAEILKEGLV